MFWLPTGTSFLQNIVYLILKIIHLRYRNRTLLKFQLVVLSKESIHVDSKSK